ncbi:related to F1F0-ATPase complex, subunit h [Cephalotrichum gorgonifer]|uniref:Related to F1F0-ATPase complex, subunit h n=1 Tax=Cephalotrichum gorgonifer TaxID=2041049 RepID=A0AAE8SQQ3_9PEZI|nr:related to F1F0-ATPase complex, subunit h [Cephalotrichum gorgonifer]
MFQIARSSGARSAATLSRMARGYVGTQTRTFVAPTVARRADFVQELYLKELKAYKTPAVKPTDSEGHVQVFSAPKTPASPEEADLASSLKEYESMAVEVEGAEPVAAGAAGEAVVQDWLEEEETN